MEDLLDQVEALAPLPHVASRVIQLAEGNRFSAYDLAAVIATDTALTAKILRLANSAHYGFPRRIKTVRDSVVLIGFRAVRATAIAAAVIDLFPEGNGRFNIDLFWGHSVACALVAETLAKETGHAKPDEAFTAGILHDIGRLILNQYQAERFAQTLFVAINQQQSLETVERAQFGFDHTQVGAGLAERWSLPKSLCAAISNHHNLQIAPDRDGLTYVVAHANAICHRYGLWCGLDTEDGSRLHLPDSYLLDENDPVFQVVARRLGNESDVAARVQDFLRNAHDRDVRWYTPLQVEADPAESAA